MAAAAANAQSAPEPSLPIQPSAPPRGDVVNPQEHRCGNTAFLIALLVSSILLIVVGSLQITKVINHSFSPIITNPVITGGVAVGFGGFGTIFSACLIYRKLVLGKDNLDFRHPG